jgi:phosphoribosylformylglycinamidine (FGAM) synthase-like enzyme
MMLSESQERMLMVLRPEKEAEAKRGVREMGPRFRHRRRDHRPKTASSSCMATANERRRPADVQLGDEAPEYDRPWVPTAPARR